MANLLFPGTDVGNASQVGSTPVNSNETDPNGPFIVDHSLSELDSMIEDICASMSLPGTQIHLHVGT